MILYIGIVLILAVVSYIGCMHLNRSSQIEKEFKKKNVLTITTERVLFLLLFLLFWALTAFRAADIGNDTNSYISTFRSINNQGPNHGIYMEMGFQYLVYLIGMVVGNNPHLFLVICATLSYVPIFFYVYKKSENYYLSVCLFFCLFFSFYTNVVRQGLATIIGLVVYFLIKKGKKLIPILLILVAIQFHYSSIVLFVLFFKKLVPKKLSHCYIISAVLLVISIIGLPNKFLALLIPRYYNFFQSDRVGTGYLALSYEVIINALFCWFSYYALSDKIKNSAVDAELIKTVFTSSLFITCLAFNMNLISRANRYFLLISIIELPNMIRKKNIGKKNLVVWIIILLMLLYFIVAQIFRPEWNHLYPYHFWKNL